MSLFQYQHTPRGRTKWNSSPVQLSHWGQGPSPPIVGKTGCSFQIAGQVTYPEMPGAGPPVTTSTSWFVCPGPESYHTQMLPTAFSSEEPQPSPEPSSSPALPHPATQGTPLSLFPILCPNLEIPSLLPSSQVWRKAIGGWEGL